MGETCAEFEFGSTVPVPSEPESVRFLSCPPGITGLEIAERQA